MNRLSATLLQVLTPIFAPSSCFAWGPEGHHVILLLAIRYMRLGTAARVRDLLGSEAVEDARVWADEYRHSRPDTGPWHYIDIPLAQPGMDMVRQCLFEEVLV